MACKRATRQKSHLSLWQRFLSSNVAHLLEDLD
jgi:hypothetical protein